MSVWSQLFGTRDSSEPSDRILDQAVAELRAVDEVEQLSPKSRAFIVEELVSGSGVTAPSGLRGSVRLALAAVPVVLAGVLVVSVGGGWRSSSPDWVKVEKVDGEVVFTLADSSRSHRVLASTDARRFKGARELRTVGGEIQVDPNDEPNLVFYRVE